MSLARGYFTRIPPLLSLPYFCFASLMDFRLDGNWMDGWVIREGLYVPHRMKKTEQGFVRARIEPRILAD
jgi:hypothetical protein